MTHRSPFFLLFPLLFLPFLLGVWFFRIPLQLFLKDAFAPPLPPPVAYEPPVSTPPSLPEDSPSSELPSASSPEVPRPAPEPGVTPPAVSSDIPTTYNLAVPFVPQAPFQDWSMPWQEACEEASVFMVHLFYEGRTGSISPEEAKAGLEFLLAFEESLGFGPDTTALQTGLLADQAYGLSSVEILTDPTIDDIRRQIASGHPVIVPAYGKALPNPNFRNGGPVYHMLVVKGYTETHFITNDPGTRLGADFLYTFESLLAAIHDWNGGDVEHGDPLVLVVSP